MNRKNRVEDCAYKLRTYLALASKKGIEMGEAMSDMKSADTSAQYRDAQTRLRDRTRAASNLSGSANAAIDDMLLHYQAAAERIAELEADIEELCASESTRTSFSHKRWYGDAAVSE